jgi:hypothetical protein
MAAPNIVSATSVTAKTVLKSLDVLLVNILSNSQNSGKLYKISSLIVANKSSSAAAVTVNISTTEFDVATLATLAHERVIAANETVAILDRNTPIYLQEHADIAALASVGNALDVICAYEEVT